MNHSDTIKDKYRKQIINHSSHTLTQVEALSIFTSPIFQKAQHIGCYKALKPEIDIENLLKLFVKNKKKIYLPIPNEKNTLSFAEWKLNEPLIFRHKCWVPSSTKTMNVKSLDCIIVPCLGVDIKHQRLGRGSGYYDRTISRSCNTVGIISPFQQINESIGYSHDITLKEIIVID
ncbi:MAG: 5-formyltetrahydrofolate cyclo-ligase [Legionellales bacterium]|mgnify:CR=1 FL=1|nr:5-formyltetrahydrofolate cyclo-ligase [Legionellales bacterium]OUX66427.1 MAG: 5-formyltetrahydrofolate cyclo-ligase [Gammaproteobacteria bacterium TMED281]